MSNPETTDDITAQLRETRRMNVPYQLMMDAANEIEQLRRVLKWARTCVPFPSDCHTAIVDALEGRR